jgi:predicted metal-dependent hydrolase
MIKGDRFWGGEGAIILEKSIVRGIGDHFRRVNFLGNRQSFWESQFFGSGDRFLLNW